MYSPKTQRKPGDPPRMPTTQQPPEDLQRESSGFPLPPPMAMPPMPTPGDAEGMGPGMPPPSLSDTSNVLAANPGGMGFDMNGPGGVGGTPSPGGLPANGTPWTPQDKMMAAYLAATLGGSVGTMFKRPAPPAPISPMGPVNPAPASTPTASQAALGLATNRKSGKSGFGGRG